MPIMASRASAFPRASFTGSWSCGVRREWNPAPKLGQDSVELLRELGYADADIDAMLASGATLDGRIAKP